MPNVAFILDTSCSMNMRVAGGLTLLDCAKSAIEQFIKARSREVASVRSDRYMLVTCEEGPGNLRSFDSFPFKSFQKALKVTKARDLSVLGTALKRALDVLNLHRLATGVDTYGSGMAPHGTDPATVILLTDGTDLTSASGSSDVLSLPMEPSPGSELTKKPFRWDQRLFTIILRIAAAGTPEGGEGEVTDSVFSPICDIMGGKCTAVTSLRSLVQSMDAIAQRVSQPAVVVGFERLPLPPSPAGAPRPMPPGPTSHPHRVLYTHRTQTNLGLWPIPEAFWLDPGLTRLPPREAQPTISYRTVNVDPYIPKGFPVDKYDLEDAAMAAVMSAEAAGSDRGVCWQVFVQGSKERGGPGDPFGFLRLNRGGAGIALYVLPYGYPALWKLLDQLQGLPPMVKQDPPSKWRGELERYVAGIPPSYGAPLRAAFKRMGIAAHVVQDVRDGGLSYPVASYLKRLQGQAKAEVDRTQQMLAAQIESIGAGGDAWPGKRRGGLQHIVSASVFSNAFNVPRDGLLAQVPLLQVRVRGAEKGCGAATLSALLKVEGDVQKHNAPIAAMGDYAEAVRRRGMLRDPLADEEEQSRQQRLAFGNPFRDQKREHGHAPMAVDEAVDMEAAAAAPGGPRGGGGLPGPGRRRAEGGLAAAARKRARSVSPAAAAAAREAARSGAGGADPSAAAGSPALGGEVAGGGSLLEGGLTASADDPSTPRASPAWLMGGPGGSSSGRGAASPVAPEPDGGAGGVDASVLNAKWAEMMKAGDSSSVGGGGRPPPRVPAAPARDSGPAPHAEARGRADPSAGTTRCEGEPGPAATATKVQRGSLADDVGPHETAEGAGAEQRRRETAGAGTPATPAECEAVIDVLRALRRGQGDAGDALSLIRAAGFPTDRAGLARALVSYTDARAGSPGAGRVRAQISAYLL